MRNTMRLVAVALLAVVLLSGCLSLKEFTQDEIDRLGAAELPLEQLDSRAV